MKKLLLLVILALMFSAVNPWPARLTVINKGEEVALDSLVDNNVYIRLSYHNQQRYFLTATVAGNTDVFGVSVFEITRHLYDMEAFACGEIAEGTLDLNKNVKLVFTACDQMPSWWKVQYWGEPGQEKPNFYQEFENYWAGALFQFEVVE